MLILKLTIDIAINIIQITLTVHYIMSPNRS